MKELWDYHDNIVTNTPKRSVYWGLHKTTEEAQEWEVTDPDINEDQFLDEGADIVISWMTAMKSAGYSYEVTIEAIRLKMNVVINRVLDADFLCRTKGMEFDEAYQKVKLFNPNDELES